MIGFYISSLITSDIFSEQTTVKWEIISFIKLMIGTTKVISRIVSTLMPIGMTTDMGPTKKPCRKFRLAKRLGAINEK